MTHACDKYYWQGHAVDAPGTEDRESYLKLFGDKGIRMHGPVLKLKVPTPEAPYQCVRVTIPNKRLPYSFNDPLFIEIKFKGWFWCGHGKVTMQHKRWMYIDNTDYVGLHAAEVSLICKPDLTQTPYKPGITADWLCEAARDAGREDLAGQFDRHARVLK